MTGSRVVATITATALSPFHDLEVIVMTLIWKLGTAAILVGLGALFTRRLFSWGCAALVSKQPPMARTTHCPVSLDR
jgi:hypothetical protein